MQLTIGKIIGLVIALLLIGILLPIGLNAIVGYNGSYWVGAGWNNTSAPTGYNQTVATLLGVIVPIMVVITLILAFIPKETSTV